MEQAGRDADVERAIWFRQGEDAVAQGRAERLSAAFARACHEKTPLVVDNSYEAQVDAFVEPDAVVLIAKQMFPTRSPACGRTTS